MKDVFELLASACYRCNKVMASAAHRVGELWFCSICFYKLDTLHLRLYDLYHQTLDEDLARKERKITE